MKALCIMASAMLMSATGALAQEAIPEQAAQQEKRICKTDKMTGSLTRRTRTCLTRSQWSRLSEGSQKNAEDIIRDANQKNIQTEIASPLPGGNGW